MAIALILGNAACVYEDEENARKLFTPDAVVGCNNIGRDYEGHIDVWCTLHPLARKDTWEGMEAARRRRIQAGRNDPVTWAHKPMPGIDYFTDDWTGSSGLFAVKVMLLEYKYDHIVLAGVPMSREAGHYFNDRPWNQAGAYHKAWFKHQREIAPYVRSMSGWSKELLGMPTPEWLVTSQSKVGKA